VLFRTVGEEEGTIAAESKSESKVAAARVPKKSEIESLFRCIEKFQKEQKERAVFRGGRKRTTPDTQ
jgi:hypothetical protein